jgi:hypothetical protein
MLRYNRLRQIGFVFSNRLLRAILFPANILRLPHGRDDTIRFLTCQGASCAFPMPSIRADVVDHIGDVSYDLSLRENIFRFF